ncbi:Bicarbonate transport system permease protein CmpB [Fervidicola ferrireducens]|jgi:NitT/TauT family transport system permease protein|uniref:Bicarbonate transport system permease protein CmpB n=1 Tax=Fervidicola ferrireducens TaxID=520764 RepID=A0A140L7N9_9FIRM|nr:ABC transporter permease subunit [Fervidicola ferrireducens]KXG76564.1 Bicarbonate transport system permease protein CmpB [Fervidicola ferrireducens]
MKRIFSKLTLIFTSALLWESARIIGGYSELLLPGVSGVARSLWMEKIELLKNTAFSLKLIGFGLAVAFVLAMILAILCMASRAFQGLITDVMAVMHPLPGIAILPVAILWFGIGVKSVIFVIVFSAVWPLLNHFYTGFRSIPKNQLEVGRNLGLSGVKLAVYVMLPASLPHILGGLRTGWARAWQASVAAELVFGAAGGHGGLGWYLYKKRFMMETPGVFAGMIVIIAIGLLVEYFVFSILENLTVKKLKQVID